MEQKKAEEIIIKKFDKEKNKAAFTYKELAEALGLHPKEAKKHLQQMVKDRLLAQHNAGTIYYEKL